MFFKYVNGKLKLKRGSEDTHALKVGNSHYVFDNEDLKLLKLIIMKSCSVVVDRKEFERNHNYNRIDDFYVNTKDNIIGLSLKADAVIKPTDGEMNEIIDEFIYRISNKGGKMETKYINEITILDKELFIEECEEPINNISVTEIMGDTALGSSILTRKELVKIIDLMKSNCNIDISLELNNDNYILVDDLIAERTTKGLKVIGININGENYKCKDIAKTLEEALNAMPVTRTPITKNNYDPRFGNPYPNNSYIGSPFNQPCQHPLLQPKPVFMGPSITPTSRAYLNISDINVILENNPITNESKIVDIQIMDDVLDKDFLTKAVKHELKNLEIMKNSLKELSEFLNKILKDTTVELLKSINRKNYWMLVNGDEVLEFIGEDDRLKIKIDGKLGLGYEIPNIEDYGDKVEKALTDVVNKHNTGE